MAFWNVSYGTITNSTVIMNRTIEAAQLSIDDFVTFYNERQLHGGIKNTT
jgi:transposase InsO family protein